jgi:hypothetical protein
MKTVGLKYFRNHLKETLSDLPVALTLRGQTVAICVSSDFFDYLLSEGTHGTKNTPGRGGEVQVGEVGHSEGDAPQGGDPTESG